MRRASRAERRAPTPSVRDAFYAKLDELRVRLEAAKPDALIVVAAEHFANFFMNNMPAYCMGMADAYEGPIEDEAWLAIKRRRVPGNADLSRRVIEAVLARRRRRLRRGMEVRSRHHGAAALPDAALRRARDPRQRQLPGPPLTPLTRAYEFGRALRRACDAQPERIALRRHRRHLALARDARLRHDQRSLGSRVPRRVPRQRSRCARLVQRRGDAARRGAGRLRDPHVSHGRRRNRGRHGRAAVLRPDPDLRRRLHGRDDDRQIVRSQRIAREAALETRPLARSARSSR